MNTTESNKLIAEFMGYRFGTMPRSKKEYLEIETTTEDWTQANEVEDLQFNCSWDWLIPVVNKCSLTAFELNQDSNFTPELYMFVTNDINAVYAKVVDFIEWYNKQITQRK